MTTAAAEVYEYSQDEIKESWMVWSGGLWWPDFEEAGVRHCYIAWIGDEVAGFQTVNDSRETIAIEVRTEFRGHGVALALIEESESCRPERDENPAFWAAIANRFEDED